MFNRSSFRWSVLAIIIIAIGCFVLLNAGNADTGKTIERKLHIIVSNPKTQMSSNPFDYIKANQKAYDDIVKTGQPALTFMLEKFEQGNENGLEEWVMARACSDILGDKNTVQAWSSGREWYEKYSGKQSMGFEPDYLNKIFEMDDLDKLFAVYNDKLDGAYAEGYGSSLVRLYNRTDTRTFVNSLSKYPKNKIDGIAQLFVGELFIEGKKDVIDKFKKIKSDKNLTKNELYVIDKILSFSAELELEDREALAAVSKEIDKIKKDYKEDKILNVQRFNGQYVLIESKKETFANRFDLYNLGTGKKDTLPTGISYVTLQKIVSENEFIFLTSGRNSECNYADFPYIIKCIRDKDNNFKAIKETAYFKVNESASFGSKENEILSSVSVGKNSIRVVFSPKSGEELEFYADYVSVPPTQTQYVPDKEQLIFQFTNSLIDKKYISNSRISAGDNAYINSLTVEQNAKNSKMILD